MNRGAGCAHTATLPMSTPLNRANRFFICSRPRLRQQRDPKLSNAPTPCLPLPAPAGLGDMFGPTKGDASGSPTPSLFIEVERISPPTGEEVNSGGGKVIRDGMAKAR